jgi:hypothetical protein
VYAVASRVSVVVFVVTGRAELAGRLTPVTIVRGVRFTMRRAERRGREGEVRLFLRGEGEGAGEVGCFASPGCEDQAALVG